MTTISASSATAQQIGQPRAEPKAGAHKQRLLDRISAQQQAGTLSATDASALTSAIQDIDQTLSGTPGASGSGTSGARLDPAQARSRIDDLIGAEVTKGTLTSEQATTLKSLLPSHKGGQGGGHAGGIGGQPPGPPPADAADPAGATGATDAASSGSDLLASFLKQLQGAQSQATGYDAGGSGNTATASRAAVFDFKV